MRLVVRHALLGLTAAAVTGVGVVGELTGADSPAPVGSVGTASSPASVRSEQRPTRGDARPAVDAVQLTRTAAARRTKELAEARAAWEQRQAELVADRNQARARARAEARAERVRQERQARRQGYEPGTTSPRDIARQIMDNRFGWGDRQFTCYDELIKSESQWQVDADNPTSSAYGIPQALPGSKMASVAADWRTDPGTQITWGLGYVEDVYGDPCSAWGFKQGNGWY